MTTNGIWASGSDSTARKRQEADLLTLKIQNELAKNKPADPREARLSRAMQWGNRNIDPVIVASALTGDLAGGYLREQIGGQPVGGQAGAGMFNPPSAEMTTEDRDAQKLAAVKQQLLSEFTNPEEYGSLAWKNRAVELLYQNGLFRQATALHTQIGTEEIAKSQEERAKSEEQRRVAQEERAKTEAARKAKEPTGTPFEQDLARFAQMDKEARAAGEESNLARKFARTKAGYEDEKISNFDENFDSLTKLDQTYAQKGIKTTLAKDYAHAYASSGGNASGFRIVLGTGGDINLQETKGRPNPGQGGSLHGNIFVGAMSATQIEKLFGQVQNLRLGLETIAEVKQAMQQDSRLFGASGSAIYAFETAGGVFNEVLDTVLEATMGYDSGELSNHLNAVIDVEIANIHRHHAQLTKEEQKKNRADVHESVSALRAMKPVATSGGVRVWQAFLKYTTARGLEPDGRLLKIVIDSAADMTKLTGLRTDQHVYDALDTLEGKLNTKLTEVLKLYATLSGDTETLQNLYGGNNAGLGNTTDNVSETSDVTAELLGNTVDQDNTNTPVSVFRDTETGTEWSVEVLDEWANNIQDLSEARLAILHRWLESTQ